MEEKKQKPVARFTAYPVEATVWENERVVNGAPAVVYAVRVGRTYKDPDGKLKTATSFGVDELPKALYVLAQAYAALLDQQLGKAEQSGEGQEVGEGAWTS